MAAFVVILYSISRFIARTGYVFYSSDFSLTATVEYILQARKEYIIQEYIINHYFKSDCSKIRFNKFGVLKMNDSTGSLSSCDMALDDTFADYSPDKNKSQIVCSSYINELKPGDSFILTGTLLHTCESFSVNFIVNNTAKDIAFHFNPRLPQNYVVRNSKINHQWCKEEVVSPFNFGLHRGHKLTLQFVVTETCFLVAINGHHFGAYEHRLPYKRIKLLEAHGDVKDVNVNQTAVSIYPELVLEKIPVVLKKEVSVRVEQMDISKMLAMPYNGELPMKLMHGTVLHILGRVKILPHSFFINLQRSSHIWPHPEIQFHFNPRFTGGRHHICCNSWLKSKWGNEQRTEFKDQFTPGKQFHLEIHHNHNKYGVTLFNELLTEYQARDEANLADTIYIQGDIKLYDVFLESI